MDPNQIPPTQNGKIAGWFYLPTEEKRFVLKTRGGPSEQHITRADAQSATMQSNTDTLGVADLIADFYLPHIGNVVQAPFDL